MWILKYLWSKYSLRVYTDEPITASQESSESGDCEEED